MFHVSAQSLFYHKPEQCVICVFLFIIYEPQQSPCGGLQGRPVTPCHTHAHDATNTRHPRWSLLAAWIHSTTAIEGAD